MLVFVWNSERFWSFKALRSARLSALVRAASDSQRPADDRPPGITSSGTLSLLYPATVWAKGCQAAGAAPPLHHRSTPSRGPIRRNQTEYSMFPAHLAAHEALHRLKHDASAQIIALFVLAGLNADNLISLKHNLHVITANFTWICSLQAAKLFVFTFLPSSFFFNLIKDFPLTPTVETIHGEVDR